MRVQQTNHINVVGVKRGSGICPNNTWQIKMGSGNPKDTPVCSALDPGVCPTGTTPSWADVATFDNGDMVSLNGIVLCSGVGATSNNLVPLFDPLGDLTPSLSPLDPLEPTNPPEPTTSPNEGQFLLGAFIIFFIILVIIIVIAALVSSNTGNRED